MNEMLRQLKDIKGPVAVPDHSLWWLVAIVTVVVLVASALLWRYYAERRLQPIRRRKDPKKEAIARLAAIDYGDTKEAVYTFGEYLPRLIEGDETLRADFEALERELAPYKYKKEVPNLSKEHIKAMKRLIKKGVAHG